MQPNLYLHACFSHFTFHKHTKFIKITNWLKHPLWMSPFIHLWKIIFTYVKTKLFQQLQPKVEWLSILKSQKSSTILVTVSFLNHFDTYLHMWEYILSIKFLYLIIPLFSHLQSEGNANCHRHDCWLFRYVLNAFYIYIKRRFFTNIFMKCIHLRNHCVASF